MQLKIGETLRELRKQKGISQETLAEYMNLSVQAISKWECGQSYPDITFLPVLAEYYQVRIDYLLTGEKCCSVGNPVFPDDNVLRVVQFRGNQFLRQDQYDANVKIPLLVDKEVKQALHVEIWGSADINGNVTGNVQAGNSVNCGNVGGYVKVGNSVNCGNVAGDVKVGNSAGCGNVEGNVHAGNTAGCGNVGGNVDAHDLHCKTIQGDVKCRGNIYYEA